MPNQEKSGRCVPIKSCKSTLEFLKKILLNPGGLPTPSERDQLLALQCGQTKKGVSIKMNASLILYKHFNPLVRRVSYNRLEFSIIPLLKI